MISFFDSNYDRDFKRSKKVYGFNPRIDNIDDIYVDSDEQKIYAASLLNGCVSLCYFDTGKVEKELLYSNTERTESPITSISMDKSRIAMGDHTGRISLTSSFNTSRGNPAMRFFNTQHTDVVNNLSYISCNTNLLVSTSRDRTIKVWNISSMSLFTTLVIPSSEVSITPIRLLVDRKKLIVVLSSGTIISWDDIDFVTDFNGIVGVGKQFSSYTLPYTNLDDSRVVETLFDARNNLLLIAYSAIKNAIVVYDLNENTLRTTLTGITSLVTSVHWNTASDTNTFNKREYNVIAVGDDDGNIYIFDFALNNPLATLNPTLQITSAHKVGISKLSVDSYKIISASFDGVVKCWDILTGKIISTLNVKLIRSGGRNAGGVEGIKIWTEERFVMIVLMDIGITFSIVFLLFL